MGHGGRGRCKHHESQIQDDALLAIKPDDSDDSGVQDVADVAVRRGVGRGSWARYPLSALR